MYRIEFLKKTRPITTRCVVETGASTIIAACVFAKKAGLTDGQKVTFTPISEFTPEDKVDEFNSHQYQVLLQYK